MSLTILESGTGHFGTRYYPPEGEDPVLTASYVTNSEIDFSGTYNGHPITLWFRGSFDLSRVPDGATLFEDYQPLATNASLSSFGFTGYWTVAFNPAVGFEKVFELVDAKSDLDFENALSGNDVFRTSAQGDESDNYFLYAGNDTLYQNHSLLMSDDVYLGGAGIDTLVLPGRYANYNVEASGFIWDTIHNASILEGYFITDETGIINTTQINEVERIRFSDASLALDTGSGEIAGSAYRLYKAAFDRAPDEGGLGYWIDVLDDGGSLQLAANGFIHSAEFQALYGANPSDTLFLTKLYNNVLDRDPDQGGLNYWIGQLNGGMSRESALINFSESNENVSNVATLIENGIQYQPWLG